MILIFSRKPFGFFCIIVYTLNDSGLTIDHPLWAPDKLNKSGQKKKAGFQFGLKAMDTSQTIQKLTRYYALCGDAYRICINATVLTGLDCMSVTVPTCVRGQFEGANAGYSRFATLNVKPVEPGFINVS